MKAGNNNDRLDILPSKVKIMCYFICHIYFITNETIFYRTKKVKILTHRVYE